MVVNQLVKVAHRLKFVNTAVSQTTPLGELLYIYSGLIYFHRYQFSRIKENLHVLDIKFVVSPKYAYNPTKIL